MLNDAEFYEENYFSKDTNGHPYLQIADDVGGLGPMEERVMARAGNRLDLTEAQEVHERDQLDTYPLGAEFSLESYANQRGRPRAMTSLGVPKMGIPAVGLPLFTSLGAMPISTIGCQEFSGGHRSSFDISDNLLDHTP